MVRHRTKVITQTKAGILYLLDSIGSFIKLACVSCAKIARECQDRATAFELQSQHSSLVSLGFRLQARSRLAHGTFCHEQMNSLGLIGADYCSGVLGGEITAS